MGFDLRRTLRNFLESFSLGRAFLKLLRRARGLEFRLPESFKDPKELFTYYYEVNRWQNPETLSGDGSTLANTENVRSELPALLSKWGVHSLLDAPCGDFNWFQHVQRPEVHYIGGDIVGPLIERNRELYGSAITEFQVLNIMDDPLPEVDLWLCRDVLFHFSHRDTLRTLENFARSSITYLLTSSHVDCETNSDISTGGFRFLNLEKTPYSFPPPIASIDDSMNGSTRRILGLWHRSSIIAVLSSISEKGQRP